MPEVLSNAKESPSWGLSLQPLCLNDIGPLFQESKDAFLPLADHPDWSVEDVARCYSADPDFSLYGYVDDGVPISYVAIRGHEDATKAWVGPMYVAESHKGQGLGKQQLMNMVTKAWSLGWTGVFVKTWESNAASRAIFESLGFKHQETIPNDRVDGSSTVKYLLQLFEDA